MMAAIKERASGLYRNFIMTQAEKLGLDNRMALAKAINKRRYSKLVERRRALLRDPAYLDYTAAVDAVTIDDGWRVPAGQLSFAGHPIIADSQAILREQREVKSHKGFMVDHLTWRDLSAYPSFIEAALHPVVLKTAATYLGMYPVLSSVKLLVSLPGTYSKFTSSQLYHLDHADRPLLKLIINVNEVTADSGPLCFLPASASKTAKQALGYGRRGAAYRVDDETMCRVAACHSMVQLRGALGDTAFVDTSQCFHYGSRNASRERRIVMYSFSTPVRSDFRRPNDYSTARACSSVIERALLDPYFSADAAER
jgi:hypothetical protein